MKKLPKDYWKDMTSHYKELFEAGVKELQAERLFTEHLMNTINEVISFTTDGLAKGVLENAKVRHTLNKIIHARTTLNPDKNSLKGSLSAGKRKH